MGLVLQFPNGQYNYDFYILLVNTSYHYHWDLANISSSKQKKSALADFLFYL